MPPDKPNPPATSETAAARITEIEAIVETFENACGSTPDLDALEELEARTTGRKRGRLTAAFRALPELEPAARRQVGQALNHARRCIERLLADRRTELLRRDDVAQEVPVDVTMPGRCIDLGGLHVITRTLEEIRSVFTALGYEIVDGPEVENDWYNFEALNMPQDHPARDSQDTLYLENDWLLRTHTSPAQIRFMEQHQPPIAALFPGRVYRRDTPDATHTPMFVQCEGLVVDTDITLTDLKGTLEHFARAFFGAATATRFRPGYFPFTEPSAELDATCPSCRGGGCRVCKGSGWVEMLGCGMVHPRVFENVGYDPEQVQGFAFGMGVDRLAAVRHGIDDIRLLYENDLGFLRQFAVT